MLFNSFVYFYFFLPLAILGYYLISNYFKAAIANAFLVACSLFFYSWWNICYLPLLLGSIFSNYILAYASMRVGQQSCKKWIMVLAIIFNLCLLSYFKYMDFFIYNINAFSSVHIFDVQNIILPLGISFFTFTQIAFQVDCYYQKVQEYSFLNYVLFVSFFPHLLAGPILHHKEMMPQFNDNTKRKINYENMAAALTLFVIGLFKKVVIADSYAQSANWGYSHLDILNFFTAWETAFSYTFQLYFDFSGYTDMAVSSALFFNIKFPMNFNSPYKATNIQEFWQRWHITLGRFMRDYLYKPLGSNRFGKFRTGFNILATFVLGGLWHGANWTYVFWGFLHGAALVIFRVWQNIGIKLHRFLAWIILFNFSNITRVFFRANSFSDALKMLRHLCHIDGAPHDIMLWLGIFFTLAICLFTKNSNELIREKVYKRRGALALVFGLFVISVIFISYRSSDAFIYFQF